LKTDLRVAAHGLARLTGGRDATAYRAGLTRAVILSALGNHQEAVATATRALALSPFSSEAYLVRARVRLFGGDHDGAAWDVERGLAVQPQQTSLIELHGILRLAAGDARGALGDFNKAITGGALDGIHAHKAAALLALGECEAAVSEWSLALRRDPELPQAFLGRARAYLQIRVWDLALADLEQAASWARSDPRLEIGILVAYLRCLPHRFDRLPRFLTLARRTARDLWGSLSTSTGGFDRVPEMGP
jgi:tetratricopeptide (TPR) repeat protein